MFVDGRWAEVSWSLCSGKGVFSIFSCLSKTTLKLYYVDLTKESKWNEYFVQYKKYVLIMED